MNLQISADMKVKDLKRQFSKQFPFLKMELFRLPHRSGEGSPLRLKIPERILLGDLPGFKAGLLDYKASLPAGELETLLQTEFGLFVQIFRKSGDLWLETTRTDAWSLEKQNEMGREASQGPVIRFNAHTLFL
ncbi:MAG TPA: hypothetical protein VHK91_01155 [Flavisolibacter sp.]|jgi:hypothetical protein|nr:hypothetical protein [Flavisolibacter sp.]